MSDDGCEGEESFGLEVRLKKKKEGKQRGVKFGGGRAL